MTVAGVPATAAGAKDISPWGTAKVPSPTVATASASPIVTRTRPPGGTGAWCQVVLRFP